MWLNMVLLSVASLCVGFVIGWFVARPRRWGVFGGEARQDGEGSFAGGGQRR